MKLSKKAATHIAALVNRISVSTLMVESALQRAEAAIARGEHAEAAEPNREARDWTYARARAIVALAAYGIELPSLTTARHEVAEEDRAMNARAAARYGVSA